MNSRFLLAHTPGKRGYFPAPLTLDIASNLRDQGGVDGRKFSVPVQSRGIIRRHTLFPLALVGIFDFHWKKNMSQAASAIPSWASETHGTGLCVRDALANMQACE